MDRFGNFRVFESLGAGGMGTVYRAERLGPAGFRRMVALKRVRKGQMRPAVREAFLREARLGGALRHPNLVDTYEVGEVGDEVFIAMSLVDGPTLRQMLKWYGPLPGRSIGR